MKGNRKLLTTVLISLSLLLLFSVAQAESYKERLTGFYGADDEGGIWYLTVYQNGKCDGLGWSDKYQNVYPLSGKETTDRIDFNFNGYVFSGVINRTTGLISGSWKISNQNVALNQRMSGSVLGSDDMKNFAGDFSGDYYDIGNAPVGTWTVLIFTDGHCEGDFRSNTAAFDEPSLVVTGGVNPSGGLILEAKNDSSRLAMKGAVSETGYVTGEWHDTNGQTAGSISGKRESAMPAEVANPNGGKDDNGYCFIRTLYYGN